MSAGRRELDQRLPYDPERAKSLLAEGGYPNGFALPLFCLPWAEKACRDIAEQLARVGIAAQPDIRPANDVYAAEDDGTAAFWLGDMGNPVFDSAYAFHKIYHTGGWI